MPFVFYSGPPAVLPGSGAVRARLCRGHPGRKPAPRGGSRGHRRMHQPPTGRPGAAAGFTSAFRQVRHPPGPSSRIGHPPRRPTALIAAQGHHGPPADAVGSMLVKALPCS